MSTPQQPTAPQWVAVQIPYASLAPIATTPQEHRSAPPLESVPHDQSQAAVSYDAQAIVRADTSQEPTEGLTQDTAVTPSQPSETEVSSSSSNVNLLVKSTPEVTQGTTTKDATTSRGPASRFKSILLVALAVTIVGAAVIGGVCGSGNCSHSDASDNFNESPLNSGSGLVYVTGSVSNGFIGQPTPIATVYDYQGNPHTTSASGEFGIWARADESGRAVVRVTAPNFFPWLITVPYDRRTFEIAKADVPVWDASLLQAADRALLVTVTSNSSWDGTLQMGWTFWGFFDTLRVTGLNHSSLQGRTFVVRAVRDIFGEFPGDQKSTEGEPLGNNIWLYYFDLYDPITNQTIPTPAGVAATLEAQTQSEAYDQANPRPTVGPWRWWKLESSGRWRDTQTYLNLPAFQPVNSNLTTLQLPIAGEGWYQIARTMSTYCVRSRIVLDTGVPCAGAQLRYFDWSSFVRATYISLDYTDAEGHFCLDGVGGPTFQPGPVWLFSVYNNINGNSAPYPVNFDNIPSFGTCSSNRCRTLPDVVVSSATYGHRCVNPSSSASSGHGAI